MSAQITQFKAAGVKAIALTVAPGQTASAAGVAATQGLDVPLIGNNPVFAPGPLERPARPPPPRSPPAGPPRPRGSPPPRALTCRSPATPRSPPRACSGARPPSP